MSPVIVLHPCSAPHPEDCDLACTLPAGHAPVPDPSGEPITFDHADQRHQAVWVDYLPTAAAA